MHWLLLLAVLSSSTKLNGGATGGSSLNRLAENALRQQVGGARTVRVNVTPGRNKARGDFDVFDVTLDGFAADRLMGLAEQTNETNETNRTNRGGRTSGRRNPRPDGNYDGDYDGGYNGGYPDDAAPDGGMGDIYPLRPRSLQPDLGDILNGGGLGDILGGDFGGGLGGVLGDVLGGGKGAGRIGRIRLRATNFTFQGARYDLLDASLGEVRFDWSKALRGDFDIKSIQPGTLGLSLNADQAARLLGPRLPSVRDLRVRFADGLAYIGGKSDLYGLKLPFEFGARLSVQSNQVRADSIRASVSKLRLPSALVNELTRGVNPLYDFDPQGRWPLAINLQTAGARDNTLALRGGIQWRGFGSGNGDNRNNRGGRSGDYDPDSDPNTYPDEPANNRKRRAPQDILGGIFGG